MNYFKIIQKKKVVNIGCTFLKWERDRLFVCSEDDGQFIQSLDEKSVYRDSWMKEYLEEFTGFENAKVVRIDETEFNDLKAMLDDGEEVSEQEVLIQEQPEETIEPQEDKPLSIAEMRRLITEQQKQIEELMAKVK